MTIEIRPFSEQDYPAMTVVHNTVYQDYQTTAEEWQQQDRDRHEESTWGHFLAEENGTLIGVGTYGQDAWMYQSQNFRITVYVLPDYRRRGIGTALLNTMCAALAPFEPQELKGRTREDFEGGIPFLTRHGFEEVERDWESHLDPTTVKIATYNGLEGKLLEQGIELKKWADLRNSDPDSARKIYELDWEASQDIPLADTLTKPPFETYLKNVLQSNRLVADGSFIATVQGEYVGMTSLVLPETGDSVLYTGFTGVARAYRRRGIALALKLKAIAYAQEHGKKTIKTWNAQKNRPMLSINERLGFIKQPAWIMFKKEMTAE